MRAYYYTRPACAPGAMFSERIVVNNDTVGERNETSVQGGAAQLWILCSSVGAGAAGGGWRLESMPGRAGGALCGRGPPGRGRGFDRSGRRRYRLEKRRGKPSPTAFLRPLRPARSPIERPQPGKLIFSSSENKGKYCSKLNHLKFNQICK